MILITGPQVSRDSSEKQKHSSFCLEHAPDHNSHLPFEARTVAGELAVDSRPLAGRGRGVRLKSESFKGLTRGLPVSV